MDVPVLYMVVVDWQSSFRVRGTYSSEAST
jgi:hypothetical protein